MSVGKQILTAPVRLLRRKTDFAQYSSVTFFKKSAMYQNNVLIYCLINNAPILEEGTLPISYVIIWRGIK